MSLINTTSTFRRSVRKLSKKYHSLKKDLLSLLDILEQGDLPGAPVSGFSGTIYKVRIQSSDQKRGKRGGFRVIYFVDQNTQDIWLLTVYAKARKENIRVNEIQKILDTLL